MRHKYSVENNVVELEKIMGNKEEEEIFDVDTVPYSMLESKLKDFIKSIFESETDQKLAWMIVVEKQREYSKYGTVLGLNSSGTPEQTEIIKKHKDRVNAQLRRKGLENVLKELKDQSNND